ncbi:hypothetical protein RHS04_00957 [Rhizoctonia solani]|uniref:CcmS related domain-containing protein n=1 Tax=Rhizoctonia solani TaxID=456999 RepID=A0A8H7HIH7_9AGAM|nr:hypothetical protein RHS04_00957 [Rhizoctonia solani]
MPIRKPRRQTLQELAYLPAIGGKDLRADEALLGLSDWELGDHSTRYPQSLLSSSFDGSRSGGNTVGGSVIGSTVMHSSVGGSDVSRPSLAIPSTKASETSSGMSPTRSEATHVRRKKPPALSPEPVDISAHSSTASSSPPKSSVSRIPVDGVVRPGHIVPPDWSAAAVSVLGSAPPSVVAPTPAPASIIGSTMMSSTLNPPSSYKQLQSRRSSQPAPRTSPSGYSHSHSHSQPLVSAPTLPPIAASPRTSVADAPPNPTTLYSNSSGFAQGQNSLAHQTGLKPTSLVPQSSSVHSERMKPSQSSLSTHSVIPKPTVTSSRSQLLQVPPPSQGFSSLSHSSPASIVGSHISEQSSQGSRALPVPPHSTISTAQQAPAVALSMDHTPSSSIQAWRTGITTSSSRGWGTPFNTQTPQHNISHLAYGSMASIPPTAHPHPSNFRLDHLSSRTQGQLSVPPPPTRRYSYDTPTSGLPLPSQLSTTLDGYTSSPDVSSRQGASPVIGDPHTNIQFGGDDGKPAIQRAPSKLRRKLTKNRGWVPNTTAAAAPAASTSTVAPAPRLEGALAPRPQISSARGSPPRVIQSGGQALVPAQRAFIGSHRPAQERILWGLPLDRDPRVRHAIQKIERIKEAVITFGVRAEQFVDTKMKGAVICNVDYRSPNHPEDLAFDWITYKDAQKTLDSTLQKSVTRTDPTNTVLVVIFLLSPSLNSLAIWRKSLSIDPTKFDRVLAYRVNKVKRETADQEKDMVIKL